MRADCFPWPGATDANGYGRVGKKYAHRVMFEAAFGAIPEGQVIRHECDNPPCVNPWHLKAGTQADNMRDMAERGRSTKKLTPQQEHEIRERFYAGESFDGIAADYGVSSVTVGAALADDAPGRGSHVKKLTWEQREYAVERRRLGYPVFVIAKDLGVTDGAIYYHIKKAREGTA